MTVTVLEAVTAIAAACYLWLAAVVYAVDRERAACRRLLDEQEADHWRRTEHYRRKLRVALGADDLFDDIGRWREKTR